jgi:hypothetical protein
MNKMETNMNNTPISRYAKWIVSLFMLLSIGLITFNVWLPLVRGAMKLTGTTDILSTCTLVYASDTEHANHVLSQTLDPSLTSDSDAQQLVTAKDSTTGNPKYALDCGSSNTGSLTPSP